MTTPTDHAGHVKVLRAVRSVFEHIPAPCTERDALDAAIALQSAPRGVGVDAVENLRAVLCDSEGRCCIAGSDEDRAIVDRSLFALTAALAGGGEGVQAHAGFEAGWRTAANWMGRDDLIADIGSPAYIADRNKSLAGSATAGGDAKFPARYACNGPEGTFWTDNSAFANWLITSSGELDRDEWTVTDTAAEGVQG